MSNHLFAFLSGTNFFSIFINFISNNYKQFFCEYKKFSICFDEPVLQFFNCNTVCKRGESPLNGC